MLKDLDAQKGLESISRLFVDQQKSKNHARHINRDKARASGLKVIDLESDAKLQELVLSVHHLMCITFQQTTSAKIIASNSGAAYINHANPIQ